MGGEDSVYRELGRVDVVHGSGEEGGRDRIMVVAAEAWTMSGRGSHGMRMCTGS